MEQPISIDTMLTAVADAGGSDLHICTGFVPVYRKDGKLYNLSQLLSVGICTDADMQDYIWQMVHREIARREDAREDIDASYTSAVLNQKGNFVRCRMNAFHDRNGYSIALRLIPEGIPKMTDLRLPLSVRQLTQKEHGLVIVCGPTGSGKTTTLASMLECINESQDKHIITIEDPVEYLFQMKTALISQREVQTDCESFASGPRSALRQDPDVILVGEMRDAETISTAIAAAETGHLVFTTLHTASTTDAIDRILRYFPAEAQRHMQSELAACFQGVIAQKLLPRAGGGRVAAFEVLLHTDATENLIRQGQFFQLKDYMTQNHGMIRMDDSVRGLKNLHLIG